MGLLDAPPVDFRNRATSKLVARRDLPGVVGYWDASALTETDGTALSVLPDASGNGNHLKQPTTIARPTVASASFGGVTKKYLAFGSAGYMARATLANGDWLSPVTIAQPFSFAIVCRLPSGSSIASTRWIMHLGNAGIGTGTATGSATLNAGASVAGGPSLADSGWHIISGIISPTGSAIFLDGQLVGSALTTGAGSNTLAGLALGGTTGGGGLLNGDIGEAVIASAAWTTGTIGDLNAALGRKWNITVGTAQAPADVDATVTSPNGQTVRIWEPPTLTSGAPLIIYSHNYTGTEALTPGAGVWAYPLVMAAVAEGWRVAASRQHADSWGNQNALDDDVDLYNLMNTRQAVTKVIRLGASMGGLSALLSVPDGRMPVKGVYVMDAVTNLADVNDPQSGFANYSTPINTAYSVVSGTLSGALGSTGATSIPTTASFPTVGTQLLIGRGTVNAEIVTTTGASTGTSVAVTATTKVHSSGETVSDYPTKTSGHDPQLISAPAYISGGVRYRFVSAIGDTNNVNRTKNIDLFATKVAAATEAGTLTHAGGHLAADAANPADFVAFVKRCIA